MSKLDEIQERINNVRTGGILDAVNWSVLDILDSLTIELKRIDAEQKAIKSAISAKPLVRSQK